MTSSKKILSFAAYLSFAVAIFQAGISFSPSLSQYFGAPEQLVANRLLLILAGLFMAVVFVIFGLYALSGAGLIRRLPMLPASLFAISIIYILRGLKLVPEILIITGALSASEIIGLQSVVSSFISFFIGIVYLVGTLKFQRSKKPV